MQDEKHSAAKHIIQAGYFLKDIFLMLYFVTVYHKRFYVTMKLSENKFHKLLIRFKHIFIGVPAMNKKNK